MAAAFASGQPLDRLSRYAHDEAERFFARTVNGPDRHVYWTGGKSFETNDKKKKVPARWWWEHKTGQPLSRYFERRQLCSDLACINAEHLVYEQRTRIIFSTDKIIGALQVLAMRLGRAPTRAEWVASGSRPSIHGLQLRFGSYSRAVRLAGLTPTLKTNKPIEEADCIAGIRYLRSRLNRDPFVTDLQKYAAELHARELPSSATTYYKHFSTWAKALEAARE